MAIPPGYNDDDDKKNDKTMKVQTNFDPSQNFNFVTIFLCLSFLLVLFNILFFLLLSIILLWLQHCHNCCQQCSCIACVLIMVLSSYKRLLSIY